ncbi:hypothetical protein [Aquimarina algiphila]|uniref:hypothetical protein n=1 Tax=Aquimarina algiphila TaxID=2047982 RepID=UPI002491D5BF|nr:hypothetical protein [Aquimarina algiphila]
MLKNILNLRNAQTLSKSQQKSIHGVEHLIAQPIPQKIAYFVVVVLDPTDAVWGQ